MGFLQKETVIWIAFMVTISRANSLGYNTNLFTDIRLCASKWVLLTPSHILDNSGLASQLMESPNQGLQYLFLLEPYLTYLLTLNNPGAVGPTHQETFNNYCKEETGVRVFINCVRDSRSVRADLTLVNGNMDNINILENLYSRYCNNTGVVKAQVLSVLSQGRQSQEIRRLAQQIIESAVNGSLICYDVIESPIQSLTQLLSDDHIQFRAFINILQSGIETFTRCLVVTISPNEKALMLKQHLEITLLALIDSSVADVTRAEMSVSRQTVSLAGYNNVRVEGKETQSCSKVGTQHLLGNNHMLITGTLMYGRGNGSHLSYLAAVHIKFPVYDTLTHRLIGEITYSSGMDEPLETELVTWWWKDTEVQMAHASSHDHGISLEIVENETIEIMDLRTGMYLVLSRIGNLLNLVIRMPTTFLYQSSGILLDKCRSSGHTSEYGVLYTSPKCRAACYQTELSYISSMCQKDCLLSSNAQLLRDVYRNLEALYTTASEKDNLIEEMLASKNEPRSITVQRDEAFSFSPSPPNKVTPKLHKYTVQLATPHVGTTKSSKTKILYKQQGGEKTTLQLPLPKELKNQFNGATSSTSGLCLLGLAMVRALLCF